MAYLTRSSAAHKAGNNMGLDTSHNCFHGPYSSFHRWRCRVAYAAGIPLTKMEGFWKAELHPTADPSIAWVETKPISWDAIPQRPLNILLSHSDCDGKIDSKDCAAIADDLETVLHSLDNKGPWPSDDRSITQHWILGLRAAAAAGEDVGFH